MHRPIVLMSPSLTNTVDRFIHPPMDPDKLNEFEARINVSPPGSIPGAGTVDQAVHPSGVGKLVAVSKKWVTAIEDCDG
jgi:hypothetical protein